MATAGKVIVIGNLKGGVGKSTLSVNLGSALAERGLRTVVMDTDPQQTSTLWTKRRRLPCMVEPQPIKDLSAVGDWMLALARARENYARVIIDLPAVLSPALAAAFLAADVILIPTTLSPVDLEATRRTLRHAKAAIVERSGQPPDVLVVPTLIQRRWFGKVRMPPELKALDAPVGPTIRHDPAFTQAFAQSDWVSGQAPRSAGSRDIARLATTLEALLGEGPEARVSRIRQKASLPPPPKKGGGELALTGA